MGVAYLSAITLTLWWFQSIDMYCSYNSKSETLLSSKWRGVQQKVNKPLRLHYYQLLFARILILSAFLHTHNNQLPLMVAYRAQRLKSLRGISLNLTSNLLFGMCKRKRIVLRLRCIVLSPHATQNKYGLKVLKRATEKV